MSLIINEHIRSSEPAASLMTFACSAGILFLHQLRDVCVVLVVNRTDISFTVEKPQLRLDVLQYCQCYSDIGSSNRRLT